MSGYIYPAYLYKDNATFADIEKLIRELRLIREEFVDYVVDEMLSTSYIKSELISDYFNSPKDYYYNTFKTRTFRDALKKDTSSYEKGRTFDCSCNVVIYFHNGKIVIHEFSSELTKDFLRSRLNCKDYSFYDIYNGNEEITEEMEREYSEKSEFYDSLFSETSIPSNVGLVFEFFRDEYTYDIEDKLANNLFGKSWYKAFVKEAQIMIQ